MADIQIIKGYRDKHFVKPVTEAGRRWLIVNINNTKHFKSTGELLIPIDSEFAPDLKEAIEAEGLDVDLD